jgi:UDP-arabinose 4-epimerase
MNILVTGGAGYIGSHACKALARAGHTPVTLDNFDYGHRRAVKWGPLVEGDLADSALLRRTVGEYEIDAVMHFAAYAYVGESMTDPGKYFRNNVANTINLLDVMAEYSVDSIVFSSTCATYGVPDSVPIDERHPQKPVNPYGESKLFIERALHWYSVAHGIRVAALRYFNAAGADPDNEIGEDHEPETHLIPLVSGSGRMWMSMVPTTRHPMVLPSVTIFMLPTWLPHTYRRLRNCRQHRITCS